jgi:Domain of unknown function (DUF4166)
MGFPLEIEAQNASVHVQLLRDTLAALPAPIRRLHERRTRQFAGRCRIDRGSGLLSRLIALVMGFPRPAMDAPMTIRMEADVKGDVWRRDFNGSILRSVLRAEEQLLVEQMGPAAFHFRLVPDDGGITWMLVAMRLCGVPIPRTLHPRMHAREAADGERYLFSARAEYPIIGLLVHYRGWLDARA